MLQYSSSIKSEERQVPLLKLFVSVVDLPFKREGFAHIDPALFHLGE